MDEKTKLERLRDALQAGDDEMKRGEGIPAEEAWRRVHQAVDRMRRPASENGLTEVMYEPDDGPLSNETLNHICNLTDHNVSGGQSLINQDSDRPE